MTFFPTEHTFSQGEAYAHANIEVFTLPKLFPGEGYYRDEEYNTKLPLLTIPPNTPLYHHVRPAFYKDVVSAGQFKPDWLSKSRGDLYLTPSIISRISNLKVTSNTPLKILDITHIPISNPILDSYYYKFNTVADAYAQLHPPSFWTGFHAPHTVEIVVKPEYIENLRVEPIDENYSLWMGRLQSLIYRRSGRVISTTLFRQEVED